MITYSTYTNIGGREINEDSFRVVDLDSKKLFLVADGLGGHGKGEVASGIVSDVIASLFNNNCSIKNFLEQGVLAAQKILIEEQQKQNTTNEMKTTIVALMIDKKKVKWIHCGDSRLYCFSNFKVVERTLDHSIPQMLVLAKEIKEEDIRYHSERNIILRVMGTKWENPQYEITSMKKIKKIQAFLLCTDGFWELITEDYMEKYLAESSSVSEWLDKMSNHVKQSGRGKDIDNNTAIAVWCE